MRTLFLGSLILTSAAVALAEGETAPSAPAAAAAPAPVVAPAPEPAPAPTPLTAEQEKQAFMAQGYYVALQARFGGMAKQYSMSEEEVAALVRGVELAVRGGELDFDVQAIADGAEVLFRGRAEAAAKQWSDANEAFLTAIDANPEVTKTASGLRYKILAPGAEAKPTAASKVKALYTGKLCNGSVFDTTDNKGGQPLEFSLSGVVKGWTEGLQLIGKGGKIQLWVPADLGYGSRPAGSIPPGSVLEFEVELVDFQ